MKKIMSHRMADGSLYRVMQSASQAFLEYFDAHGKMEVLARGELSFVEAVYAEKIGQQPVVEPVVAVAAEPVAESVVQPVAEPVAEPVADFAGDFAHDCQHDPCRHPDCDCQPSPAASDPAPFAE